MQLFGKAGAEVLPSLKAKVDELANSTGKMSAESVEALDALGDAFGELKTTALNLVGSIVAEVARIPLSIKKSIEDSKKFAQEGRIEGQTFTNQPLSVGQAFAVTAAAQGGFSAQFPSDLLERADAPGEAPGGSDRAPAGCVGTSHGGAQCRHTGARRAGSHRGSARPLAGGLPEASR
jgi:hypothetical protein